jgi:DNA polymerase-3 subunit delta'
MNEWNIIGHDWAVRRLRQQIASGQLAQSHLFVGPPSVGKAAIARALAGAVLSVQAADPVRTRRLVQSNKHPDLTWIGSEEGSIKVEKIREMLHALTLAPIEGRYRVAVADDAHLATDGSKNAILKTLEEPNQSTVIIMIAPSTDGVLPTITSRCQVLNLRPVAIHDIAEALAGRGVDATKASFVAQLARGRPGWALRATESDELLADRAQRIAELEELISANRTRRFAYAETLAKADAETLQAVLEEWLLFWLDVVRANDSMERSHALQNVDRADSIRRIAERVATIEAVRMVRAVINTLRYVQKNASARLALDVLMLKMPVV